MIKQLNLDDSDIFLDVVQQYPTISQLISPIENNLLRQTHFIFKLINFRKISDERRLVVDHKIRSVIDQRLFISELQNKEFPSGYEHLSTMKHIIDCLF